MSARQARAVLLVFFHGFARRYRERRGPISGQECDKKWDKAPPCGRVGPLMLPLQ